MQLSDAQVKEFQALYKKHFGKSISYEQAQADGMRLIRLVSLTQPRKKMDMERLVSHGKQAS